MINQVVLVGRLVQTPDLKVTDNGKKVSSITLAVPRAYKNIDGEYDTDFIDCTLWTGIAENTAEYCKTGDVIGVKGRLQTKLIEKEDGSKYKRVDIVAERVTFLSSNKPTNLSQKEESYIDINADINDDDSSDQDTKKDKNSNKKKK